MEGGGGGLGLVFAKKAPKKAAVAVQPAEEREQRDYIVAADAGQLARANTRARAHARVRVLVRATAT